MKRILTLLLLGVSFLATAQTKLIEKVEKKGDEIVIPYAKYELENGLTLVVHEDHSDPLVHVDVTYHVGSAREEINKSGFAHFFEHMMFQGSENVADEEHFKIVTESGGTLNGSTNRDRTNYYETLPANQLETALWLEADRMGFFLDAVTQEKFEVQRATVKNEKQQNYDNRPYGLFRELNAGAIYPYGHPYSWLTIGRIEDLNRVDVNDLKSFFLRWYGPNNATLTVGGDVNAEEVVQLVEKYFGVIPRGPEVESLKLEPAVLEADRYVSYIDKNIRFPGLIITYPTVPQYHEDEAALDCLSEILGTGKSSYFYKKFVMNQKAIQASSFHPTSELAGEFSMFVLPFPGQTLDNFEGEIRGLLTEFEENGVTDEDIEKFKATRESSIINRLASVSGKVSQLASYETFLGNPNAIQSELEKYMSITKEDVMRVFRKYIKNKPAVYLSVLSNEVESPAKPDNYEIPMEGVSDYPTTDYSGLEYKRPAGDKFDRSKRPPLGPNPVVKVPEFWTKELDNGLKVIGTNTDEIPTVTLQLTINGGHKIEASDFSKIGIASLTASMMNEATQNYSSEAIQEELRKLGSSINLYSTNSGTIMNVNSLKKNIGKTMELAEEILLRPGFAQVDFDRLKKQQLEGIKANKKDPSILADQIFNKLIYGEDHIYGIPSTGIENTVAGLTLDDVKEFYNKYYSPSVAELVIVGDVSADEIKPSLKFFENWEEKKVMMPVLPETPKIDDTKIYLVDKTEAPQSEIRIGYLTDMKYDATGEYFKSYLMNFPLGGAFNSRINLNLREDKGWTYGARSYFNSGDDPGPYLARAGVKASATDSSIVEFMAEIKNYADNGITEDELAFMRKAVGQRDARSYETPGQKAGFLRRIVHFDLDRSYVDRQTEIINSIKKEEIDALAKKYLDYQKMNILVVGDEASNLPKLEKLGYPIVKLDTEGKNRIVRP